MIRLVTGGVRSGKSAYAEELAARTGDRVLYVATGWAGDEEMAERIRRHRERRPPSWTVVEESLHPALALEKPGSWETVMVDCLSTWVTNRLMKWPQDLSSAEKEEQIRSLVEEADDLITALSGREAVLVTSETGWGGVAMSPLGRLFQDALGAVNQRVAQFADEVWMVISGIPWRVKG
ncbi:bifunctional adenosylcobinamide kinase/adenosylcobinamide-phosphate guanylyltransferase [Desmospora profundinema]|uniref:Adenosylcobinamide kinase n=1 Tax=Desmospora profundinema TaxID=1571184 RepID=A0ABU1IN15_9BACL|nr:bifunctional adenosylcobinamide kinase/adenosylcobinamide-phosphate guanylyltransferase [Desmospora profundinema]MDR6226101.1 adenosylcobinamide kinase/adenosylcobinamide-phosphate guanylyltransferase [Desmospora profundinema]